jgi:glutamate carboxypeptidase
MIRSAGVVLAVWLLFDGRPDHLRQRLRWSAIASAKAEGLHSIQPATQPVVPTPERAILAYVEAHNRDALALLERVVNINSGTQNFAGVREVGAIFRASLDALGFKTRWVDGAAFQRAGHLVAEHPGSGAKILLIGHLDTVFERDSPFQKFQRIDAASAKGPGIIDMKGGDIIILQTLGALESAGALKDMNVTVVMTGDEEDGGRPLAKSREALVAAAAGAEIAIGFEDGPGDPRYAVTARRGTMDWQLRVTGTPAHSSQIFREDFGHGAIFETARLLNTFREKMAGEEHLTFNPGVILGGTAVDFDAAQTRGSASGKTNVIAGQTVVAGDLRTLSAAQLERAIKTMQTVAATSSPRTQATLSFGEGYPPLAPSDGNARLLAAYDRASRDLGFGPVAAISPDKAGAADVSFIAGQAKMILDGVGLMGHDDHTPGETADLRTLPTQAKRAALTLYRLTRR